MPSVLTCELAFIVGLSIVGWAAGLVVAVRTVYAIVTGR